MTLGTGIVISVGILCFTFVIVCLIGASIAKQKQQLASELSKIIKDVSKLSKLE